MRETTSASASESVDLLGLESGNSNDHVHSGRSALPQQTPSLLDRCDSGVGVAQTIGTSTSAPSYEMTSLSVMDRTTATPRAGGAGFLEMEDVALEQARTQTTEAEPIQTSSGLLLTHRVASSSKKAPRTAAARMDDDDRRYSYYQNKGHSPRYAQAHRSFLAQAKRMLTVARLGVLVWALALVAGAGVILGHVRHEPVEGQAQAKTDANGNNNIIVESPETGDVPDRAILVPLPNLQEQLQQQQQQYQQQLLQPGQQRRLNEQTPGEVHKPARRLPSLHSLREQFDAWAQKHGKQYHSHDEKEKRFHIWSKADDRIRRKNERHGPCKLTQQPVFGHNHLSDLTLEEFQSQFLHYTGPTSDNLQAEAAAKHSVGVMHPDKVPVSMHPEVHRRIVEQAHRRTTDRGQPRKTELSACKWYNMSCFLRYFMETYLMGLGGVMEPRYDEDSYPSSIDWRDVGAVTEVRSQGNCGACWAITAVETVESAVFLKSGTLYDLSEAEVTACSEDCEMCYGGWPQDAFDYIKENNGITLSSDIPYDGDVLLALSDAKAGESDEMNEDSVNEYMQEMCPNKNSNSYSRYGAIEGYGYATERCTCYTDGSGCDCDSQNEGMAVRNLATYGPAVVCVDASTWQDYNGGILTADSGCSQEFLDVNHCVQAVGYAYTDGEGGGGDDWDNSGSGSGDNKSGSGSGDNGGREGYWIVRNQWSSYWGMSGYAWVAMGENTCGILNDMVQVYVK